MADIAIGLHGGCGTLSSHLLSAAEWAESREHLAEALRAGWGRSCAPVDRRSTRCRPPWS